MLTATICLFALIHGLVFRDRIVGMDGCLLTITAVCDVAILWLLLAYGVIA